MRRLFAGLILALPACLALTDHTTPFPCATDADCTDGLVCRRLGAPQRHVCAEPLACTDDLGCDGGLACRSLAAGPKRCVATSACLLSTDCPAMGASCTDGVCVKAECLGDEACGGYRCVSFACHRACASPSDCTTGYECAGGACAPRSCTSSAQCSGYACIGGKCKVRCDTAADCESPNQCTSAHACGCEPRQCGAYACFHGKCQTSCAGDGDCDLGAGCEAGTCHRCVGTPTTCDSLATCQSPGCSPAASCDGSTFYCSDFDGDGPKCKQTIGCSWNVNYSKCGGVATCASQSLATCASNAACKKTTCTGTPKACNTLSAAQCRTTLGCTLE